LLEERLVKVIETRSDEIAKTWYKDIMESNYAPGIKNIPDKDALDMATNVYKKLGYWLLPTSDHKVQETYVKFGADMFKKGFRMEEVVMVLILIKRHLWLHLLEEGVMGHNLELYQALEINNKVVLYFDRAIYYALIGYRIQKAKKKSATSVK